MYKSLLTIVFGLFLIFGSTDANAEGKAPMSVPGAETIGLDKAKALHEAGALFVDLRQGDDYLKGHIPSAEHMELAQEFNKDGLEMIAEQADTVVFYCYGTGCLRSSMASESAVKWGFTNVKYFRDGMPAWKKAGYEIEATE